MIQIKLFRGTIADIEAAFNAWAANLAAGTQFPQGIGGTARLANDQDDWVKEVVYVLPIRSNITMPKIAVRGGNHGEPS